MRYSEALPPVALSPWIRCFWFLTTNDNEPQPVVPDGRLEIVLHRARPFSAVCAGGSLRLQEPVMVSGQLTRPIALVPGGRSDVVGIRFRTAGARDLLRLPLGELTDRVIPLKELDPTIATALHRAAHSADPLSGITAVLVNQIRAYRHTASVVAVSRLARGETVASVSQFLGLSIRTLERYVRDDTGLPPKVLQRIMRFRTLYNVLQVHRGAWARAAVQAGYYDQTHANRDFRQFAGSSPGEHFSTPPEIAKAFLSHSS